MLKYVLYIILTVTVVTGIQSSLFAQSIWLMPRTSKSIGVEILKPNFDGDFAQFLDYTFFSSALFLSGRFAVGDNGIFVGELPIAHGNRKDIKVVNPSTGQIIFEQTFKAETIIGNPYVGFEFRKPGSNSFIEIGGRIPVAQKDKFNAMQIGISTDFDRIEAFVADLVALSGKVNFYKKNASNTVIRLRGGPTFWIPTNEGETELLFDYSGQVGYEGSQFGVIGGITGRMVVTEDGLSFGERTFHQLTISAMVDLGTIIPGIQLRFPLDDERRRAVNNVFGLSLVFEIN